MKKIYFYIIIFYFTFFIQTSTTNDNFQTTEIIQSKIVNTQTLNTSKAKSVEDTIVYITNTGKRYHTDSCRSLYASKIETTLEKAKNKGLAPCHHCNPDE